MPLFVQNRAEHLAIVPVVANTLICMHHQPDTKSPTRFTFHVIDGVPENSLSTSDTLPSGWRTMVFDQNAPHEA